MEDTGFDLEQFRRPTSLRDAIIELLKKRKGESISLQQIYSGINEFYKVLEYQNEPDEKYGGKIIEHEIRSIITRLAKDSIVNKPRRGYYSIGK